MILKIMGNNNNKLSKHFGSLPANNFPSSPSKLDLSFLTRRTPKLTKRRQQKNNINNTKLDGAADGEHSGAFIDRLFLPEYPIKDDMDDQDFEVLEVIAKGAFGNVMKVRSEDNKDIYAMKVMKKSQVMIDGAVQQCKDEATIQKSVGYHPFIVKSYFYWQTKKMLYFVMDYIPCGELFANWQHNGCFKEDLVRLYVAELALVIDFLHNSGIIYRDLKMENILLDSKGHLQVIDFGLAKWLPKGSQTRTICGTLQFIAPEILNGEAYGHTVDWWSLGIVMYALLVGRYPLGAAPNHFEMAKKVADHMYSLPEHFTAAARQLVDKLLCKQPENRLQTLSAFQNEPFFNGINTEELLAKELSPRDFCGSRENLLDEDEIPRVEDPDIEQDTGLYFGNFTCVWNESIESLYV